MINKFMPLLLELSCRPDNTIVGSGLGGNTDQFLFLLRHTNNIVDGEDLVVEKDEVNWGEKLLDKSRKEIRELLNAKLPNDIKMFVDWEKEVADKLNSDTVNAIYTGKLKEVKDISDYDLTVLCAALFKRLANETDQNKTLPTAEANNIGKFFITCQSFHYFLGMRIFLGVSRIITSNLFEHSIFKPLMLNISKLIDSKENQEVKPEAKTDV